MRASICTVCDEFDVELRIEGPAQLQRIVTKLQDAVRAGRLEPVEDTTAGSNPELPPFPELRLEPRLPDTLLYTLRCCQCGRSFMLACDLYHGAGGSWGRR